jgi:hypothetical protein
MKIRKDPLGALELLKIASKVEALAMEASRETQTYRIGERLARNPYDAGAFCKAIIDGTKRGEPIDSPLLQYAMWQVSTKLWEEMWDNAHPDQFGQAWEGKDFVLKSDWRERVRAMINECHQGALLAMTVEENFAQLTAAGQSEELAKALADWVAEIQEGHTPST